MKSCFIEKEIFYLNQETFPIIPTPHDCIIRSILIENQCVIFSFEEEINKRDSISYYKANAHSLVIKYHLADEVFSLYKRIKPNKTFLKEGGYEELPNKKLKKLTQNNLEYLYHYIGYNSIIVKLYSTNEIIWVADVDYIEYEWILKHE